MISYFLPSYTRFVLMILAFYIYYHTYGKISLGIVPVLLFPSFYITYTVFEYPENFNWKKKATVPDEDGIIDELNKLVDDPYATMVIFIPIYILITVLLYQKKTVDILKKISGPIKKRIRSFKL